MMKKRVKIGIGVIVVSAAALCIVPKMMNRGEKEVIAENPVVEVISPETGSIEIASSFIGTVEPSDVVYTYPKISGEITDIYVKTGDIVKAGQLLCRIDNKQLDSAKISMEAAKVSLDDANTNLARMQALYSEGNVSSQIFENAQSGAKSAKLQYDAAQLAYNSQDEYTNITATIDGLVESFDAELHDNAAPGIRLCVISGQGAKAVSFYVPERILYNLSIGDTVQIEKSGIQHAGQITEINSIIDAASGLFKVKASVEEADKLATGSTVKLWLTTEKADQVMVIPVESIFYSDEQPYVYICDETQNIRHIPVETGLYDSKQIEIISGINYSDQVVTSWSSELYDGSPVRLADQVEVSENDSQTDKKDAE